MCPSAEFLSAAVILFFATSRSRFFAIVPSARSRNRCSTSHKTTLNPPRANTCAIPFPIVPAPTTPTVRIFMMFASIKTFESNTAKSSVRLCVFCGWALQFLAEIYPRTHTGDKSCARCNPRKPIRSLDICVLRHGHHRSASQHPILHVPEAPSFVDGGDYDARQNLAWVKSCFVGRDGFFAFRQRGLGPVGGTRRRRSIRSPGRRQ